MTLVLISYGLLSHKNRISQETVSRTPISSEKERKETLYPEILIRPTMDQI